MAKNHKLLKFFKILVNDIFYLITNTQADKNSDETITPEDEY
jgi:hypothetical protein